MNCEDWESMLDSFIDGELSDQKAQQVRLHLESCEICATYVQEVLAMRDGFPQVEQEEVPLDFVQSVMARIETQQPPKRKKIIHWQRYALGAVACLTMVVSVKTGLPSFGGNVDTATTMTTTATMAEAAPMMERAMEERAVGDGQEERYAHQATLSTEQVESLLDGYGAELWDDDTLVYVLTDDEFWEILSQIEGDTLVEEGVNPTTQCCRILVR